jgi:hypothetical protein
MYDQSTVLDGIGKKSSTLSVSLGWDMVATSCNFVCIKPNHEDEGTARKPNEISSGRFEYMLYS